MQGNIENWLKFEIIAFYANLVVLMLYLGKSRIIGDGEVSITTKSKLIQAAVVDMHLKHHHEGDEDLEIKVIADIEDIVDHLKYLGKN